MTKSTIKMLHGAAFVRNNIVNIIAKQKEGYTLPYIFEDYKENHGLTMQLSSFLQAVKLAKKDIPADLVQAKIPQQNEPGESHEEKNETLDATSKLAKVLSGDKSHMAEVKKVAYQNRNKFIKKDQS
ncbi:hypothetical protein ACO0LB_18100 [Undibacterium sp. SXout7W]|uniref:hypothetical protein n=1 Tax=Undibacterium sp. SXout7W TaxID=3413049 RepID=UPI003BF43828